jgi:hypothetical protein
VSEVRTVLEPVVRVRALSPTQVADLVGRLQAAVVIAEGMKGIHAVYAAEANAYRQVLATLEDL